MQGDREGRQVSTNLDEKLARAEHSDGGTKPRARLSQINAMYGHVNAFNLNGSIAYRRTTYSKDGSIKEETWIRVGGEPKDPLLERQDTEAQF